MRVHELAKELNMPVKDLVSELKTLGVEVKGNFTVLDAGTANRVRQRRATPPMQEAVPPPEPRKKPADAPPAAPPAKKAFKPAVKAEPAAVPVAAARKVEPPAAAQIEPAAAPRPEPPAVPAQAPAKEIRVQGAVVVKDFADKLGVRPNKLITELMSMNVFASINDRVDVNVAKRIAERHGFAFVYEKKAVEHMHVARKDVEEVEDEDKPEDLLPRPPVVTFMGHVDHGKTSLLDRIRNAAVAKQEYGGITQHIGAYTLDVSGRKITFLDTPGHEAFTAMRARGANLTDIAVIVIAADDGVMPQTQEAVQHARAAEVAMVVAINKVDLPAANVDRVKKQLQQMELMPEDWGGQTICCPVSATTGAGLDHLLEMILLQADMLELKANPRRRARGYVVEAQMEPGMGPTATLLVVNGTLKVGDVVLCGSHWGRVRALMTGQGTKVNAAGPSTPVKCLGLSGVPEAGAEFRVHANERMARERAGDAATKVRTDQITAPKRASLADLFEHLQKDDKRELRVVLKADKRGSVEAIAHSLNEIKSSKVSLNILLSGTGNVTANDVMLATASDAVILGFCVAKEEGVDEEAKRQGVEIRLRNIIYELIDEVRSAMVGLLAPLIKEHVIGHAEVLKVFPIGKRGKVAGCRVLDGMATIRYRARVKRGAAVLWEGTAVSIKHFRDSVPEVREGQECGVRLDNFTDSAVGDILEFYRTEVVPQTL
jgi:translation initiation factor IF-2